MLRKRREKERQRTRTSEVNRFGFFPSPKEPHCRLPEQICKPSNISQKTTKENRTGKERKKRAQMQSMPDFQPLLAVIVM